MVSSHLHGLHSSTTDRLTLVISLQVKCSSCCMAMINHMTAMSGNAPVHSSLGSQLQQQHPMLMASGALPQTCS